MKKYFVISLTISLSMGFILNSCKKQVDYSSDINSLKSSVQALQARCDSLANALASTNANMINLASSIDSIKTELVVITTKINQLDSQLNTVNADITAINAQIATLNQEYATLLTKLNALLAQLNCAPCTISYGLLAWYPFTGNAVDSSGNGYNGKVNGATLTTDRFGNPNSAYLFTANPQNIAIDSLHENNVLGYSVAGWFQKNTNSSNIGGTIFCGSNPCNAPGGLRFGVGTTNQAFWISEFQSCSENGIITTNQNYADGNWHSFAATFNAKSGLIISSYFQIYIDGVLVSQTEESQGNLNNVIAPINNGSLPTILGNAQGPDNPLGDYFQGKIDDIRVWNRVLTSCEIQYLAAH